MGRVILYCGPRAQSLGHSSPGRKKTWWYSCDLRGQVCLGDSIPHIDADASWHSVAGLLSARVCTDHFDQVFIVDPDATTLVAAAEAPDAALRPSSRSRVMQYEVFHGIQAIVSHGMFKLFPGIFEQELTTARAMVGSANYNVHISGIYLRAPLEQLPEAARTSVGLTRPAYETILRRMVARDKRIHVVDGTILGFDVDDHHENRLTGTRYRPSGSTDAISHMNGDIVIGSYSDNPYLLGVSPTTSDRLYGRLACWPHLLAKSLSHVHSTEAGYRVIPAENPIHDLHIR
jgi:hypothetical protein